jgi:hypothetical protein
VRLHKVSDHVGQLILEEKYLEAVEFLTGFMSRMRTSDKQLEPDYFEARLWKAQILRDHLDEKSLSLIELGRLVLDLEKQEIEFTYLQSDCYRRAMLDQIDLKLDLGLIEAAKLDLIKACTFLRRSLGPQCPDVQRMNNLLMNLDLGTAQSLH